MLLSETGESSRLLERNIDRLPEDITLLEYETRVCIRQIKNPQLTLLINPISQSIRINRRTFRPIVSIEQYRKSQLKMRQSNRERKRERERDFLLRQLAIPLPRNARHEKLLFFFFFINLLALSEEIVRSSHPLFLSSFSLLVLPLFSFFSSLSPVARYSSRNAAAALDTLARHSLEPFSTLWQPLRPFTSDITRIPVTTSHFRGDRSPSNKIDVRSENVASRHFSSSTFARLRRHGRVEGKCARHENKREIYSGAKFNRLKY